MADLREQLERRGQRGRPRGADEILKGTAADLTRSTAPLRLPVPSDPRSRRASVLVATALAVLVCIAGASLVLLRVTDHRQPADEVSKAFCSAATDIQRSRPEPGGDAAVQRRNARQYTTLIQVAPTDALRDALRTARPVLANPLEYSTTGSYPSPRQLDAIREVGRELRKRCGLGTEDLFLAVWDFPSRSETTTLGRSVNTSTHIASEVVAGPFPGGICTAIGPGQPDATECHQWPSMRSPIIVTRSGLNDSLFLLVVPPETVQAYLTFGRKASPLTTIPKPLPSTLPRGGYVIMAGDIRRVRGYGSDNQVLFDVSIASK